MLNPLRWRGTTEGCRKPTSAEESWLGVLEAATLSRRGMLGVSAAAIAAASPLLNRIASFGRIHLHWDGRRASFWIGDTEVWIIDPAWFAGRPRVDVEQQSNRIRLVLNGARYPGTLLP